MAHIPRTKIVCTLGPATSTLVAIQALVEAGMDVARLNFSHGTHEEHADRIAMVRSAAKKCGRPVALLGDLQGPRIRVGDLRAPRALAPGDDVTLVHEGEEVEGEVPVTYTELAHDVRAGDRILIDDGLIELMVLDVTPPRVRARVIHGGDVRNHKGLNLPGVQVSAPSITEKDVADVAFAVRHELD